MLLLKCLKGYFEQERISFICIRMVLCYSYNNHFEFSRMRYVAQEYASVREDSMMRARVTHNENLSCGTRIPKLKVIAHSLDANQFTHRLKLLTLRYTCYHSNVSILICLYNLLTYLFINTRTLYRRASRGLLALSQSSTCFQR